MWLGGFGRQRLQTVETHYSASHHHWSGLWHSPPACWLGGLPVISSHSSFLSPFIGVKQGASSSTFTVGALCTVPWVAMLHQSFLAVRVRVTESGCFNLFSAFLELSLPCQAIELRNSTSKTRAKLAETGEQWKSSAALEKHKLPGLENARSRKEKAARVRIGPR